MLLGLVVPSASAASSGPADGTGPVRPAAPDLEVAPPARDGLLVGKSSAPTYRPHRYSDADPRRSDVVTTYRDLPAEARPVVEWVVGQVERALTSSVPVRVEVRWTDLTVAGLADAPHWEVAGRAVPSALLDAGRGVDVAPGAPDITLFLDSDGTPWHTEVDGDVPRDQVDLATVVLHELLHGLGFVGFGTVAEDGSGAFPHRSVFDEHLRDGAGARLVTLAPGQPLGLALRSGAVSFGGDRGRVANGGVDPALHAPPAWSAGSSTYHLDEATHPPGSASSLMTPVVNRGEAVHDPGLVALGMLRDLGWTVQTRGTGPGAEPALAARGTALACPDGRVPEDGLTDVPAGGPHEAAVDCVVWWQVALGRSASSYAPESGVTRAQMASFLLRALESSWQAGRLPSSPASPFPDVTGGAHVRAVDTLAAIGVVGGRADGTYGPDDLVTREQMATFLVRTAQWIGAAVPTTGGDPFVDDDGSPHEVAIGRAAAAGLTGGTSVPGHYAPGTPVRRDQMASFLARTLDLFVGSWVAAPPADRAAAVR